MEDTGREVGNLKDLILFKMFQEEVFLFSFLKAMLTHFGALSRLSLSVHGCTPVYLRHFGNEGQNMLSQYSK